SDLVNLSMYAAKPKIVLIMCENDNKDIGLPLKVKNLLKGVQNFIRSTDFNEDLDLVPTKPCDEAFQRCLSVLDQLGIWSTWKVLNIKERQLGKLARTNVTDEQELF